MIDHVGMSRTVGSPVAVDLVEAPDAVTLDEARAVGVAGAHLLARRPGVAPADRAPLDGSGARTIVGIASLRGRARLELRDPPQEHADLAQRRAHRQLVLGHAEQDQLLRARGTVSPSGPRPRPA